MSEYAAVAGIELFADSFVKKHKIAAIISIAPEARLTTAYTADHD
jgi:hypothetical protein